MTSDIFLFTAAYAVVMGALASLIQFATADEVLNGSKIVLPFVIGGSLAMLMGVLLGRLRAAHLKELVVMEIAFCGAVMLLEDNNVQRLRGRLAVLVPPGLRS